jgi:GR25 family glycosyltransferase involved in LPS biosynthesis
MDQIDHVYYINLDHRTDRRAELEGVLDDLEIPVEKRERISAVYDAKFGALGCIKSHIRTLETFLQTNSTYCMILEDDFIYDNKEQFIQSIQTLFSQKVTFDLVQLAYNHNGIRYEETEYPILKKVIKAGTTSGMIVHKAFAEQLVTNYKESEALLSDFIEQHGRTEHHYCLDVYWQKLQPAANWFCFMPRLGHQRASYSDIENRHTDYGV